MLLVKKKISLTKPSFIHLYSIFLVLFIIILDQATKIFVKINFASSSKEIIGSFFKISFIENKGIAFGIDTSQYHIYIVLITILAIFILFYYFGSAVLELLPIK